MISDEHIKTEVDISHRKRNTTIFLRKLLLTAVDRSLRLHYGNEYSMKCLQSSVAIQMLLNSIGVKSEIWVGATCYAKISSKGFPLGWNGFWDEDHHIWVVTEFYELVDLTISELHTHPASIASPQLPVPAVWWSDISIWPCIIRYLPNAKVDIELPEKDMDDLSKFKSLTLEVFDKLKKELDIKGSMFWPILLDPDGLNTLCDEGNKWLQASLVYQKYRIPLPDWMIKREMELESAYKGK